MRVRLLGPIDVEIDGSSRPVAGLRRKAVLAALALEPGRIVSTDRLVDIVWRGAAPATATNTLQSHLDGQWEPVIATIRSATASGSTSWCRCWPGRCSTVHPRRRASSASAT